MPGAIEIAKKDVDSLLDESGDDAPRRCCSEGERFCVGCGNYIVPGENGYVQADSVGGSRHYHVACLIRFLWSCVKAERAWGLVRFVELTKVKSLAAEWKGNHGNVVALKRAAEGKGPRPEKP